MPAVDCVINHGVTPDIDSPLDEPNILVNSLTITPARELKEYKGGGGCVKGLSFRNPTLSFAFDGYVSAKAGLADQQPGTTVASLVNYQEAIHGFDKDDGILVYHDPSREATTEDVLKTKFTVTQYPFVAAS